VSDARESNAGTSLNMEDDAHEEGGVILLKHLVYVAFIIFGLRPKKNGGGSQLPEPTTNFGIG